MQTVIITTVGIAHHRKFTKYWVKLDLG